MPSLFCEDSTLKKDLFNYSCSQQAKRISGEVGDKFPSFIIMQWIFVIVTVFFSLGHSSAFASRHDTTRVAQIFINIQTGAQLLTVVTFILAVAMFGWGGAKFIFAAGDVQKIDEAKKTIWWSIIGMFIIATIGGIIYFIGRYLGIDTGYNPPLNPPQF